jgi:polar amino acid transport system substrate-binding protein
MRNTYSFRAIFNRTPRTSANRVAELRGFVLGVQRTCLNSVAALCAAVLVTVVTTAPVLADTLSDIKEAGVVKFGVKTDVKPWAYLNTSGEHVGFEIDMARVLAERMGVEPEFVSVTSANRIQYLQQDRIDIVLATMSDTPARREVVRMIEPHYFGDASNFLAPAGSEFETWDDLNGAVVCAVSGAIYNKWVAEDYNAEVKAFQGPPQALAALQQNQCEGFIFSDQILRIMQATQPELKDYVVALEPIKTDYWTLGVSLDSEDDSLAEALSSSIAAMLESGKLLELAKPYDLDSNPYLRSKAKQ